MPTPTALRLACHDPGLHRSLAPAGRRGARRVRGDRAGAGRGDRRPPHGRRRGQSRRACSSERYQRGRFAEVTDRADAPLAGCARPDGARAADRARPPPKAARSIVDLWRPWIEERAGADARPACRRLSSDQGAFGRRRARPACRARTWPTQLDQRPGRGRAPGGRARASGPVRREGEPKSEADERRRARRAEPPMPGRRDADERDANAPTPTTVDRPDDGELGRCRDAAPSRAGRQPLGAR